MGFAHDIIWTVLCGEKITIVITHNGPLPIEYDHPRPEAPGFAESCNA